jgi:hypothetical protein
MIEAFKKTIPSCDVVIIADSDDYDTVDIIATCKDINRLNNKVSRVLILSSSTNVSYQELQSTLNDIFDIPFLVIRFLEEVTAEEMIYRGYSKRKDHSNFIYFVKAGNLVQTNFTSIIKQLIDTGSYFVGILNNCTLNNTLLTKLMFKKFFVDFEQMREVLASVDKTNLILEWDDINET